jgi:5'-nucleotidase
MTQILLTNDDGIESSALALLRRSLDPLGDVLTVAPAHEASAVARGITIGRPIRLDHVRFGDGFDGIALGGTPVDCVRVAMLGVLSPPPDIIVSGINFGSNMGNDVTYSGTVGAALEAALMGLPGVAISIESEAPQHLGSMETLLTALVERLMLVPLPRGVTLNVNLPDVPAKRLRGVKVTTLGGSSCHDRLVLHSDDGVHGEYRIVCERGPLEPWVASDFEAVADGYVSLTPLQFDLTSREGLASLAAWPVADLLRAAGTSAG